MSQLKEVKKLKVWVRHDTYFHSDRQLDIDFLTDTDAAAAFDKGIEMLKAHPKFNPRTSYAISIFEQKWTELS